MLNKACLLGHLGADPEVRRLNSGDSVVNLRLATSERWRDKSSGDMKERTEWHNVVIYNEGLVKVAEQYLKKGSQIYVEGKIQTRQWEKDGDKRYTTEIILPAFDAKLVMVGPKPEGGGSGRGRDEDRGRDGGSRGGGGGRSSRSDIDDEIPF